VPEDPTRLSLNNKKEQDERKRVLKHGEKKATNDSQSWPLKYLRRAGRKDTLRDFTWPSNLNHTDLDCRQ